MPMTPFEFGQRIKLAMDDFDREWARDEAADNALIAKAEKVRAAAGAAPGQAVSGTLSRGVVTSATAAPMATAKPATMPVAKPAAPAIPKPAMPAVTKRVSRSAF